MSVTQLDLQLSQCSSVHILRRCAIARYKYCASHDIAISSPHVHVHRYLLPLPLTSTTMASPLPSPRSPSLHRADGHASPFRSSPPLVEEDASVFRSSPRRVEVDASVFPISPACASKDASAPRYEENAAPPVKPPTLRSFGKKLMSPYGRLCLQQSAPK